MSVHHRTCNLCEAMCGLELTVDSERVSSVRGDPDDVFSRGHICPKGPALAEVWADPDRLRHPVRRVGSTWQRVSWDAALSEAAERLSAIRARDGRDAIGVYVGNPTVHNHGASIYVQGFLRGLGTKSRFDANSQDTNPKLFACMLVYGDQLSITVPDVDRTRHLLMLGANPAASNGSLMTLGDVKGRLRGIRERGGRVVLLDPRRTESASWCDEHHFLRPSADAGLLLALHHVLFAERLVDEAEVRSGARGLDELRAAVQPFPPERVAAACGLAAETIRKLARDFAAARPAVAYGRTGVCLGEHGAVASWLIETLNVVTGNFDRPGGAMFAGPAADIDGLGRKLIGNHYGRWRSRVRGLPEFAGQLPAAVMAEEMETPGAGRIRGFVTLAGNPVLSTANGPRLEAALADLEYMVSIDCYVNATTRHAHLILPPAHSLERGHYDLVFHALAVRNTVKYSEPVFAKPEGALEDWEILYDLGMQLGGLRVGGPALNQALRMAWRGGLRLSPDRIVDFLIRTGPYGDRFLPWSRGLSLAKVRAAKHGIDLGALEPAGRRKVRTSDGKVDLAPALLCAELARIGAWVDEAAGRGAGAYVLIGRRHVRSNNSWMHNCSSLSKGPDRATLLLHPDDAKRIGVAEGGRARVTSRTGEAVAPVELSDEMMPGVASLPHGFGHQGAVATLRVAGAMPGSNVNALTDETRLCALTGTAALNGVPVEITPA